MLIFHVKKGRQRETSQSYLGIYEVPSVEKGLDSFYTALKGQIGTD